MGLFLLAVIGSGFCLWSCFAKKNDFILFLIGLFLVFFSVGWSCVVS